MCVELQLSQLRSAPHQGGLPHEREARSWQHGTETRSRSCAPASRHAPPSDGRVKAVLAAREERDGNAAVDDHVVGTSEERRTS